MAKVSIHGQSAVLTSGVKMAELEKIQKYEPQMLNLTDDKGKVLFGVSTGKEGSISRYGVCFNDTDNKGFARLTICGISTKEEVVDTFGKSLLHLNELEALLGDRLSTLNGTLAAIEESIKVVQ